MRSLISGNFVAMLKTRAVILLLFSFSLLGFVYDQKGDSVNFTLSYVRKETQEFISTTALLKDAISKLDPSDSLSVQQAREKLLQCRLAYKKIEFFLEYFIPVTARPFNRPPVYEVEEPYMEFQHPAGMQLMEAYLFENINGEALRELRANADLLNTYASGLPALYYEVKPGNETIFESLQLELVRIITLGITGYDAPCFKSGVAESAKALESMKAILPELLEDGSTQKEETLASLDKANALLGSANSFDEFNRLTFLVEAALPLQARLASISSGMHYTGGKGLEGGAFNIHAENLFKRDALNLFAFMQAGDSANHLVSSLGRRLFYEKSLSGNGKRSCGSCHDPSLYFTDQIAKSVAFNDTSFVKRNAQTLLYAPFQHSLFADARAGTFEEQILAVLQNRNEMNSNLKQVIRKLKANREYRNLFRAAFPAAHKDSLITIHHIALAIAGFEQKLMPFNSKFDDFMNGQKEALTEEQKLGFNLFMGKAACATCHFAPLFNGLTPPAYKISELEIIGVPADTNFNKPVLDNDSGRFHVYQIEYNIGAFKTPTLRNIAKTAPYMHNGAFKNLEQVMTFYNRGGGQGIGLDIKYQTLSNKPLNLTEPEIQAVIAFLGSLTDELPPSFYKESPLK